MGVWNMKTIVITGCNRGIGNFIANELLKTNEYKVIGLNRTKSTIKDNNYEEYYWDAHMTEFSYDFSFDVIILNAGSWELSDPLNSQAYMYLLEVNAVAPIRLLEHFSESLKGKHIITIGSSASYFNAKENPNEWAFYSISKLALRKSIEFAEVKYMFKSTIIEPYTIKNPIDYEWLINLIIPRKDY